MSVVFQQGSVVIDGKPTFLLGGEFTPYRLAPELWRDRMEKLKAAGINTLGVYWAWNYYSLEKGKVDFTSPERNIDEMLKIAKDVGLYVIARPGPYVCNEWDLGGYPGWLLKEDSGDWRTADPKHFRFSRGWFKQINPILKKHQHDNGGPIVLYQIDNEHRWNDRDYLGGLCDAAIEDGITVPLVGNHDGGANSVADKMLDCLDIYTNPLEFFRWRAWMSAHHDKIGHDKPLMILEFAAGSVSLWGDNPPNNVWPPPHWSIAQGRLFTAMGANVVSYFVAAGGTTPIGFNSDHIPTSYMENAPIAPEGTLTPRFYELKLLGDFLGSFSREMSESKQTPIGWGTDNLEVEALARVGKAATFYFPMNLTRTPEKFHILRDGVKYPARGEMSIDAFRTQVLVADADLGDGLQLKFCSLQIQRKWTDGATTRLVVYGPAGESGSLVVSGDGQTQTLDLKCGDDVSIATAKFGSRELEVYVVSRATAERTWFVQTARGVVPVFSNIDLVRPQKDSEAARAEIAAGETLRATVPDSVRRLKIDGKEVSLAPAGKGLSKFEWNSPSKNLSTVTVSDPQGRVEDNWSAGTADRDGWREARPWGKDAEVLVWPDDYQWKTSFDVAAGALPDKIEFLGIANAEITVWLNGQRIGTYPQVRLPFTHHLKSFNAIFDVAGVVKAGRNELAVNVHFHGRHNSGQPIYAGLSHPVVLRRGDRKEVAVPKWNVSPVTTRKWISGELDDAKLPSMADATEVDLSKFNTHRGQVGTPFWREARFYQTKVAVPAEMRGKPLFLECPAVEEMWAYVDGKCIERTRGGVASLVDLTAYSNRESIDVTIAVRHVCFGHGGLIGLGAAPKLITADQVLDGSWQFRRGSQGAREKWAAKKDGWKPVGDLPAAERVWYRRSVRVSQAKGVASPLFVELQDFETHATIWWNGEPVGLWGTIGPQRRFFIDDGKVKPENDLVIEVDGYGKPAKAGSVSVGFYYQAQRFAMEIEA